ncbi:MAG: DNA-binding response regulator [Micrococcaceae bacterium]|uniref:DNA-binding response regulator n=1 Tax=Arthrobacter cheniae TaxID=1258888 RepID=A0A3A5M110_9MICC|nr:response regulator transcription factor [Arthrobacter cheniae]MCU1633635.1 DNA-binding response regulator [Micrococcaceae bacterium]RJT77771.1 DNA-binding response regulator [Arthrobacter cheniae]
MKVLIADDDPQILRALSITFTASDYDVVTAADGAAALRRAAEHHPDIVVLDLGMPRLSGIDVIHGLRGWSSVPILVVSGRMDSIDKVQALDAGADDYVTKPFLTDELLARVRALTRRRLPAQEEAGASFGDVRVDLVAKSVVRTTDGSSIHLTRTEWRLLETLMLNPGRLVAQENLLTEVWGPEHVRDSGYLRLYIRQLRKKLEPDPSTPRYLLTEAGMGYRFMANGNQRHDS